MDAKVFLKKIESFEKRMGIYDSINKNPNTWDRCFHYINKYKFYRQTKRIRQTGYSNIAGKELLDINECEVDLTIMNLIIEYRNNKIEEIISEHK